MSVEQIKPGYKRTEFGVIPKEWSVKPISACCDYVDYRGKTPPKMNRGIFLVTARNVRRGFIDYEESQEFVPAETYEQIMSRGKPRIGDVLITTEAPLGNVAQVDREDVALAQRIIKYRPKNRDLSSDYLLHYFLSDRFQKILNDHSSGSTAKGIKGSVLYQLSVVLPSPIEQRSIATALSDADALLAKLDRLIGKKRDIKQAAMQQLLTGQTRLPGFSGEWMVKRLGEIAEIEKGEQLRSDETNAESEIPHYNGGVSPSGFTHKENAPANSIAISEGGNSCGFVQFIDQPFWCGGHCYLVTPKSIDKKFLYQALKGRQKSIMELRVGSGLPNVQKTSLLAFSFESPMQYEEQSAIAAVLSDMDTELAALEARRDKTRALKQGMMQELLTGRIRLV